jgi:hypothetical protein
VLYEGPFQLNTRPPEIIRVVIEMLSWLKTLADFAVKLVEPTEHPAGAALTAQGAKVTHSPVASSSGITQTIGIRNQWASAFILHLSPYCLDHV